MARFFRTILPDVLKREADGERDARYQLSLFYWQGRGMPKDEEKAAEIWQELAKQGHIDAACRLGLYLVEKGSIGEALPFLRQAAKAGDTGAIFTIGKLHYEGRLDGKPDYAQAMEAFLEAGEGNLPEAWEYLARMFYYGQGMAADKEKSAIWLEKCAKNANPEAQFRLGYMFLRGIGVEKNYGLALRWLKRAAKGDCRKAQHLLGLVYMRGLGVAKDLDKAREYFGQAAEFYLRGRPQCFGYQENGKVPGALFRLLDLEGASLGEENDLTYLAGLYEVAFRLDCQKAWSYLARLPPACKEQINALIVKTIQKDQKRRRDLREKRRPRPYVSLRQFYNS